MSLLPAGQPLAGIVFDLDGTLVDSRAHILNYNRDVFDWLGRPFPEHEAELFYTLDKEALESRFFSPDELDAVNAFRRANPYHERLGEIAAIPGAEQLLESLSARGVRLALVTNRGTSTLPLLSLLGWESLFSVVISANMLPRPKPDPMGLLQVAEQWGCTPAQMLYVGDAAIDASSAAGAGTPFVHVSIVHEPLPGVPTFDCHTRLRDTLLGVIGERSPI